MSESLASLVGDFQIVEGQVSLTNISEVPLIGGDPTRWAIEFAISTPADSARITTAGGASPPAGRIVSGAQSPIMYYFRNHGSIVNVPWFGQGIGAVVLVNVTQILYRPSQPTMSLDDLATELRTLRRQSRRVPQTLSAQLSELQALLSSVPAIDGRK